MDDLKPCRCGDPMNQSERVMGERRDGSGWIECPGCHRTVNASDLQRAIRVWNAPMIPPPGYALVKLEGAEERVARAIYAKTPFYRLKNSDDRKHGETPFEQLPYEEAPLNEELNDIAQAAIRALTEGE